LALDGGEWEPHVPAALPLIRALGIHWIRGWMGLRAGLDAGPKRNNPIITPTGK